ncbi:MAG: ATP synthase F0 subunit B [Lachnospiraceae bacterium]|nr:ATP synthase F0 subunit B [Lachnospiraceae bacterium]
MLNISAANLFFIVVNLLVLYIAMKRFLFQPIQKIIAARQEEADRQFEEAAAKQAEADEMKAQYTGSIADIEEEKKQTLQQARKDADKEYQKIVDGARKEANQIKADAAAEAEVQKKQIIKKAEKEIADMVINAATKVVGAQSSIEMNASLYNEFLDKAGEES